MNPAAPVLLGDEKKNLKPAFEAYISGQFFEVQKIFYKRLENLDFSTLKDKGLLIEKVENLNGWITRDDQNHPEYFIKLNFKKSATVNPW